MDNSLLYFLLQILLDVVVSYLAFHKDAMGDKLEHLGLGSKTQVSFLEEILEINKLVILTQCHSVLIMLMEQAIHHALKLKKLTQLVLKNVIMVLVIQAINIKH